MFPGPCGLAADRSAAASLLAHNERIGRVLVSSDEIDRRVRQLGSEISRDYAYAARPGIVVVGILTGAVFFVADLMRRIGIPCELDFVATSSYAGATVTSGEVRFLKDLSVDVRERDVLLVEDIVDTGLTLDAVLRALAHRGPRSVETCALLSKRERRRVPLSVRYVGFEIPDEFVVGYGLDDVGGYRHLPFIAALADPPA